MCNWTGQRTFKHDDKRIYKTNKQTHIISKGSGSSSFAVYLLMEAIFSVQLEPQLALGLLVQVSLLILVLKIKVSHDHNQEIDPEHLQMSIQTHYHIMTKN